MRSKISLAAVALAVVLSPQVVASASAEQLGTVAEVSRVHIHGEFVSAAAAPYNYAVIRHNSNGNWTGSLVVCRDWGTSSCASNSPRGSLQRGENSKTKFGWADTDGWYVPSGYNDLVNNGPRWVKQSGCFGCTIGVALFKGSA